MLTWIQKTNQDQIINGDQTYDRNDVRGLDPSYMRSKQAPKNQSISFFLISTIMPLFLLLTGCGTFSTLPDSYHPTNPIAPGTFSHQLFDELMHRHVKDGVVNYPDIQSDLRLETYLREINQLDPTTLPTRNDRLAFWINTYNAFAIKGIVNGYSPKTKFGQYSYFVGEEYMVGEQEINLWSIERDILIPRFREPRIHFAIVCASRSCPKLRSFAFLPDQLDQQLNNNARQFINDPTKNRFDPEKKVAHLSMIFDWFAEDFEEHSGSVLKYISQFVNNPTIAHELQKSNYTIQYLEYNWNLNGINPTKPIAFKKKPKMHGVTQSAMNTQFFPKFSQVKVLSSVPQSIVLP